MSKVVFMKVEAYGALPCEAKVFEVKGKEAYKGDFGNQSDFGSFDYEYGEYDDENWSCADNHFERKPSSEEVLNKYNISQEEYDQICDELESKFCVGSCGWCV